MLGDLPSTDATRTAQRLRVVPERAPADPGRSRFGGSDWAGLDAHERQVALVRASLLVAARRDPPTRRRWA